MAEYRPGLGAYRVGEGEVGYGIGVRTVAPGSGVYGTVVDYTVAKPVPLALEYNPQVGIRPVSAAPPQPRGTAFSSQPSNSSSQPIGGHAAASQFTQPIDGYAAPSLPLESYVGRLASRGEEALADFPEGQLDAMRAAMAADSGATAEVRGLPWTQMDIVVDSNGSRAAAEAIAAAHIRGESIVRGVFGF